VNDETPTFEKSLYEFILTPDLRNFTIPAYIKAIDNDSDSPNNIVRYELIYGNYENKFYLNEITGQLSLREPLMKKHNTRKGRQASDQNAETEVFVLTARAFDLGVPVRWSTTTIRVYPPESRTRLMTYVVPGLNPDRQKIEETLQEITGGRVIIQDIRPYTGNIPGAHVIGSGGGRDRSVVTATVLYDSNSVVDIEKIQQKLSNEQSSGIIIREDSSAVS
jgi:Cadherin domain